MEPITKNNIKNLDLTNYLPNEDMAGKNCYTTHIGCAAALMSRKYKLLKIIKDFPIRDGYRFVFRKKKNIGKTACMYNNNLLKVDAETMYENMYILRIKTQKLQMFYENKHDKTK